MWATGHTLRMSVGTCALALWIVCFAAGLLVETIEERTLLAPRTYQAVAVSVVPTSVATATERPSATAVQPPQVGAPPSELTPGKSKFWAFVKSVFIFTPTNLAFLALLAGLLGGCASNILVEDTAKKTHGTRIEQDRLPYLTESPWSAMVRSFIVYLCIIAGLYVVVDDPFRYSTPAQYARLAGAVSVLSLIVGYDPTRIIAWINLAQAPFTKEVTAKVKYDAHEGTFEKSSSEVTKSGASTQAVANDEHHSDFHEPHEVSKKSQKHDLKKAK